MGKAFNRLMNERRSRNGGTSGWRAFMAAQTSLTLQLLAYVEPRIEADALGEQLLEEIRSYREAVKAYHG